MWVSQENSQEKVLKEPVHVLSEQHTRLPFVLHCFPQKVLILLVECFW